MIGARTSSMVERVVNFGARTPSMMGRQLDGVPRARKRRRRLSSSFLGDGASTIGARTTSSMVKHCHVLGIDRHTPGQRRLFTHF